jgi:hypothetical protein
MSVGQLCQRTDEVLGRDVVTSGGTGHKLIRDHQEAVKMIVLMYGYNIDWQVNTS